VPLEWTKHWRLGACARPAGQAELGMAAPELSRLSISDAAAALQGADSMAQNDMLGPPNIALCIVQFFGVMDPTNSIFPIRSTHEPGQCWDNVDMVSEPCT
jgi:hypothetical protein